MILYHLTFIGSNLGYNNITDEWITYTTKNSGLPNNSITSLSRDKNGGLWVGTEHGLAHLTFSQKNIICTYENVDEERCKNIKNDKRAAIIIHPNGSGTGYNQEKAVDFMATYVYRTLHARGYDNDEIYFLSNKPDLDFNDDYQADYNIVDAPVTLAEFRNENIKPRDITLNDIKQVFKWAKDKGELDRPLVVIFVDHGLPNELLLNPLGTERLNANTFKQLLDDYQNATDNQVVVILEACHSGTFLKTLATQNRLIITSTDAGQAYFDDGGKKSFLKLYFDNLRLNENFGKSLQEATKILTTYSKQFNQQRPQLNSTNIAEKCLNGCWGGLPGILTLKPESFENIINSGEKLDLELNIYANGVSVEQVWASVITPEIANQRNEQGYSFKQTPSVNLECINDSNAYIGSFNQVNTPGNYDITFKAKDNKGFITEAPPMTITVEGQGITQASFDTNTNILHIPAITVDKEIYQADLSVLQMEPEIILELDMESLKTIDNEALVSYSNYSPLTGKAYIHLLEVQNATGSIDKYKVNLQLEPETSPMRFKVEKLQKF